MRLRVQWVSITIVVAKLDVERAREVLYERKVIQMMYEAVEARPRYIIQKTASLLYGRNLHSRLISVKL